MRYKLLGGLAACALALAGSSAVTTPVQAQQADFARMGQLQRSMQENMNRRDFDTALAEGNELLELTAQAFGRRSADYGFMAYQLALVAEAARDLDYAMQMFDTALAIDTLTYGPDLRGEVLFDAIRFKWMLGDPNEVITLTDEALSLLDRRTNLQPDEQLILEANLAGIYTVLGRHADALRLNRASLDAFTRLYGANDEFALRALHNVGVSLARQGLLQESIDVLTDAHQRRSLMLGENHPDTINSLNSLGDVYLAMGNLDEAEDIIRRVVSVREIILEPDHPSTLASLENLADIARQRYEYEEALAIYTRIIDANTQLLGPTSDDVLRPLAARAALYQQMGQPEAAASELRGALARLDAAGMGNETNASALAYNLGTLLQEQGDPQALPLLERAYRDVQSLGGQGFNGVFITGVEYASALLDAPGRAREAFTPASQAMQATLERRDALYAGTLSSAAIASETAIAQETGQVFADALWATTSGNLDASQRDRLLQALQLNLETPASEASKQAVIRVAANRGGAAIAARIAEREELARRQDANRELMRAALAGGPVMADRRAALTAERAELASAIAAADAALRRDFPEYFAILSPALTTLEEIQPVLSAREAVIVLVPAEQGTHVVAITAQGTQWHRSDLDSEAISQRIRRLLFFTSTNAYASYSEADEWLAAVDGGMDGFDRDTAYELYRDLFGPLEGLLADKDEWLLAPAGDLAGLPFAMLVTETPQGLDNDPDALRTTPWLIDRAALTQLPSLQALVNSRRFASAGREQDGGMLLGFGNPVLAEVPVAPGGRGGTRDADEVTLEALPVDTRLADPESLRRLRSLPGTAVELNAMAQMLGTSRTRLYMAQQATETALKQADLMAADTLVLATHGLLANEVRGLAEPGLVLTPPGQATMMDDGYLSASEILELQLGSEWVILSACNTAGPSGASGTALSGLARAFLFAGAQSLLVSHWLVRDDVAPKITVSLVSPDAADSSLSRAQALRSAMIAVRNDTSMDDESYEGMSSTFAHPSAWAPFIMVSGT